MKYTSFYNYLVVEQNIDSGVISIEGCYRMNWFDKKYYWNVSIEKAIKDYRKLNGLSHKRLYVEKYFYSYDVNGMLMCY